MSDSKVYSISGTNVKVEKWLDNKGLTFSLSDGRSGIVKLSSASYAWEFEHNTGVRTNLSDAVADVCTRMLTDAGNERRGIERISDFYDSL